ncbi:MAG: M14 family zinc carboxypeptidase [Sphingomonadales bacterium]|jgi:hypothetical protein
MAHKLLCVLLLSVLAGDINAQKKSPLLDKNEFVTPYEGSGKRRTATYTECFEWYQSVQKQFPGICRLDTIGLSDGGSPIYVFRMQTNRGANKVKVLINNNIHPGEPEGTDASMLLVRELLLDKGNQEILDKVDLHIICQYNVDGSQNQSCCTRANQNGPENQGFRGNARNLDLNRDFIKADSRNARAFARYFASQKFDFFVDNHTSNGADYQYTLTYFHTRPEKLLPQLRPLLQSVETYLKPELEKAGWPTAPYVETMKTVPDSGIHAFWETGRYATGFAALHHCIGYTVETHMLKPFPKRVEATLAFMRVFLMGVAKEHSNSINVRSYLKRAETRRLQGRQVENTAYEMDQSRWDTLMFRGFDYGYKTSNVTGKPRLFYDTTKPWSRPIRYYRYFRPKDSVVLPRFYILPWAWGEVYERLKMNRIEMKQVGQDTTMAMRVSFIAGYETVKTPYEGHYLHYNVKTTDTLIPVKIRKGDWLIPVTQANYQFLAATLEPRSPDSYFAWNFFDAVLQQKEGFSDYVWDDKAAEILAANPVLKKKFTEKKAVDKAFSEDPWAQWLFVYRNSPYYEPTHNRYPVYRID